MGKKSKTYLSNKNVTSCTDSKHGWFLSQHNRTAFFLNEMEIWQQSRRRNHGKRQRKQNQFMICTEIENQRAFIKEQAGSLKKLVTDCFLNFSCHLQTVQGSALKFQIQKLV